MPAHEVVELGRAQAVTWGAQKPAHRSNAREGPHGHTSRGLLQEERRDKGENDRFNGGEDIPDLIVSTERSVQLKGSEVASSRGGGQGVCN